MTIVKPGGGFLVADGQSIVPLQVILGTHDEAKRIIGARIIAARGEVTSMRVIDAHRVQFLYKSPPSKETLTEFFDVALTLGNDDTVTEGFAIELPPPSAPELDFTLTPELVDGTRPSDVELNAVAKGTHLEGMTITTDQGQLDPKFPTGDSHERSRSATWHLPRLPETAPSYLTAVAVAAQPTGFTAIVDGISVSAPVRVAVDIPFGSRLEVKGALSSPPPVAAPRKGKTILDNVTVVYEKPLTAFRVTQDRRQPLSLVLPTGVVSTGLAVPIPGQDVADGGSGPTLILGIPPGPFGTQPFWPDLTVEGAAIIELLRLSPYAAAVVLQRPLNPRTLRVLLEGTVIGEIELAGGYGQSLRMFEAVPEPGERGAVRVEVRDLAGAFTDHPKPQVWGPHGEELPLTQQSRGVYRAFIPANTPGAPGTMTEVSAELEPPLVIAGAPLGIVSASAPVRLQGKAPVIRPLTPKPSAVVEKKPPSSDVSHTKFGLAGASSIGMSKGSLVTVGGYVQGELRFPFWSRRLGLRFGAELAFTNATGQADYGDGQQVESSTRVTTISLPLEFVIGIIQGEVFTLDAHGGGAVRLDQGALEVAGDTAGGGTGTRLTAQAGLEGSFHLGPGSLFIGVSVAGIGGRLEDLSTERVRFEGTLAQIRGELGYRFWIFP